jgi:hypothetical protein
VTQTTYYHFTPVALWERSIRQEGLKPQPLPDYHPHLYKFCEGLQLPPRGIYIWPEAPDWVLRDFMFFKQSQLGTSHLTAGVLLKVEIDPVNLLTARWVKRFPEDTIVLWHLLEVQGKDTHRVIMEVYVEPIPPTNLRLVKYIEVVVTSVDKRLTR